MKTFKYIGLISLLIFSLYVSNKTKQVVKEQDEIMINIKHEYKKYNVQKIDSIINDNTIIIGSNGYNVNIDKSYDNMKKYGKYNSNLYIYDIDKVIKDNTKYIVGFNKIALIFKIDNKDNINEIKTILDKYSVSGNYYVNGLINNKYCYTENLTNMCKNYTINPSIVINYNFLYNVKKRITDNSIIAFDVNSNLIKELPFIITYIKNSGYEIDTIDNLLK